MNDAQPCIALGDAIEELRRTVRRAVINYDDLECHAFLCEQRVECCCDLLAAVIHPETDGDVDSGCHGCHPRLNHAYAVALLPLPRWTRFAGNAGYRQRSSDPHSTRAHRAGNR